MNANLGRALRCTVAATFAGMILTSLPGPASAEPTIPPAAPVTLTVFGVNGSGCRPDTATVTQAPDNTSFQVTYTGYVAAVGPGARSTDFRKNCQVGLWVRPPEGYSLAIARVEHGGYADLATGVSAALRTNF